MTSKEDHYTLHLIQKELPSPWIAKYASDKRSVYYINNSTGEITGSYPGTDQPYNKPDQATNLSKIDKFPKKHLKKKTYDVTDNQKSIKKNTKTKNICLKRKQINSGINITSNPASSKRKKPLETLESSSKLKKRSSSQDLYTSSYSKAKHSSLSPPLPPSNDLKSIKTNSSKNKKKKKKKKNKKIEIPCPQKDETAVEVQKLHTKHDIEMLDISFENSEQKSSILNTPTSAVIYVIIDTNILLENEELKTIESLIDWHPLPGEIFKRAIIVVPWVVVQELDFQKTKSNTEEKARRAIAFLNKHFSKKSGIRGQTILEAATVIDGLKFEMNDDRLLQCCFFFSSLPGNHKTVLYSKDNNLCNKAMINKFESFSKFALLVKYITSICKMNVIAFDGKHAAVQQNFDNAGLKKESHQIKVAQTSTISDDVAISDVRDAFLIENLSHEALSYILQQEMIEAYGNDTWKDIIIVQPPWTLRDIFHCIKKHWVAVFGLLGSDRVLLHLVDHLLQSLKNTRIQKCSKDQLDAFASGSIQLIKGLGQKFMRVGAVRDSLKDLQEHLTKLKSQNSSEASPHSGDQKENKVTADDSLNSSVMFDELPDADDDDFEVQTQNFWSSLDEIWKAVVENCASILISLRISTPSQQLPPELQVLLADSSSITTPAPDHAMHVLPLLVSLIDGFLGTLEKFLSSYHCTTSPASSLCFDLLQNLWTITRAFNLQSKLQRVKLSSIQSFCSSTDSRDKLCNGYKKLSSICELLKQLSTFLSTQAT